MTKYVASSELLSPFYEYNERPLPGAVAARLFARKYGGWSILMPKYFKEVSELLDRDFGSIVVAAVGSAADSCHADEQAFFLSQLASWLGEVGGEGLAEIFGQTALADNEFWDSDESDSDVNNHDLPASAASL